MKKDKLYDYIKTKYEKRYPGKDYYSEYELQNIHCNMPVALYKFRALSRHKITNILEYTSFSVTTNESDDIVRPALDIARNTILLSAKDIQFITNSNLYKFEDGLC